ncbi:MAG TPA: PilZ domain-containing protein [Polyangiaceae bacterium]|nr:PilZ domain-containing protein [Polyangiaceae bacterium]
MSLTTLLRRSFSARPWRRRHERDAALVGVDWRAFGSAVHRVSTTADVSPGGAFVCTAVPRPVGSPLVLRMTTTRGPVEVHARVAWTDPRGMGVRFTRSAPLDLA